jgi:hypothetical protein
VTTRRLKRQDANTKNPAGFSSTTRSCRTPPPVVSDAAACRVGRRRQRSFLSTSCLLPIYAPQISTNASTNTVPMRVLAKFSQYGVEITLNTARLQPCVHHSIVAGWPSGSVNFRGTESASLIIVFRVSDKLKCKYLLRWNLQCGAN